MREAMLHIWDEKVRSLPYFTGTSVSTVTLLGAHISPQVLWVLGVSAVIVAALTLFFRFTLTGRAMRACADDRMAARLCGINDRWMVTLSFMLSAGIGALAGCVISPVTQTQYDMGAPLAIKGFTVAILGGLGNSMAAVAAGLLLGVLEAFTVSQFASAYKEVVSIVVLLLILVFRPSGLFARGDDECVEGGVMRLRRYYPVLATAVLVVVLQVVLAAAGATYYMTQITMSAYYALVVIGLCLLMGYAGQVSLGHAGFFAIGGYTSAVLTTYNLSRLPRHAPWSPRAGPRPADRVAGPLRHAGCCPSPRGWPSSRPCC